MDELYLRNGEIKIMIDLDAIGVIDPYNRHFKIIKDLDWYDGPISAILEDQDGTQYLGISVDDDREARLMRWIASELTPEAIEADENARNWLQLGSYVIEFRYEDDITTPQKTWFLATMSVPEEYLPAPQVKLSDYLK
jgi:hypothetical protein